MLPSTPSPINISFVGKVLQYILSASLSYAPRNIVIVIAVDVFFGGADNSNDTGCHRDRSLVMVVKASIDCCHGRLDCLHFF